MQPLLRVLRNTPLTGDRDRDLPGGRADRRTLLLARAHRRDFGSLPPAPLSCWPAPPRSRPSRPSPTRRGSACRWWRRSRCSCSRRCSLPALAPRVAVGLLLTPAVLSARRDLDRQRGRSRRQRELLAARAAGLLRIANYAPLARLPRRPHRRPTSTMARSLLALTPHAVWPRRTIGCPPAFVAAHRAFASRPTAARAISRGSGAAYVMTCGPRGPAGLSEAERDASLWGRLQAGDSGLARAACRNRGPFHVYRVKPHDDARAPRCVSPIRSLSVLLVAPRVAGLYWPARRRARRAPATRSGATSSTSGPARSSPSAGSPHPVRFRRL